MNEIEELQEEIKSLNLEITLLNDNIIGLEEDLKMSNDDITALRGNIRNLKESAGEKEEENNQTLELLKKLWLSQEKQTSYDVAIEDLLQRSGMLTEYYTSPILKSKS